jgi:hypothetical protein
MAWVMPTLGVWNELAYYRPIVLVAMETIM